MAADIQEIVKELKVLLKPDQFRDYCPNGLQVEGKSKVKKIVSGVTACQALLEQAVVAGADALLVHHGYFWRDESPMITGLKRRRLQFLLQHELNLLAFHLPLDAHAKLGNNIQLGQHLGFEILGDLGKQNNQSIGLHGHLPQPLAAEQLKFELADKLGRLPLHISGAAKTIKSIAWCTGAGQHFIELAVDLGVDAYLTGEVSEPTVHVAREAGIHFFSAGHHATERYGVQAVGAYLADTFALEHQFIDIDNPV